MQKVKVMVREAVQKILFHFGLRLTRIPPYVDPVAPFDALELAVHLQLFKEKGTFFFVQIGANDGVYADSLNPLIRKYGLRGCLVEPMLVCDMQTFRTFMSTLPVRKISMLYIDTEGSDDKIIEAAFEAGVFPAIINYEWSEMSAERRFLLKMKLLDNGYRFIDIGADTVCVRSECE